MHWLSRQRMGQWGAALALACAATVAVAAGTTDFHQNHRVAPVKSSDVATKTVADFDETTWAHLLAHGPRPAAYVFTTTFCSTCPQVFEILDRSIRAKGKPMELAAVVMDVPPERVLAHAQHYVGSTRFYAFDGFAPAIRQSVDPEWPNVTPYVVLLDRKGAVLYRGIGAPGDKILSRWR